MDLRTPSPCPAVASRSRVAAAFKDVPITVGYPRDTWAFVLDCVVTDGADSQVLAREAFDRADAALAAGAALGIEPVASFDCRYPALLSCTADPPPVLWIRGSADDLCRPAVAIVGSRAATPYALQVAERLAGEPLRSRPVVVSGLARGADSGPIADASTRADERWRCSAQGSIGSIRRST